MKLPFRLTRDERVALVTYCFKAADFHYFYAVDCNLGLKHLVIWEFCNTYLGTRIFGQGYLVPGDRTWQIPVSVCLVLWEQLQENPWVPAGDLLLAKIDKALKDKGFKGSL